MRDLDTGDHAPLLPKMIEISKELQTHPERFESYQHTMCCAEPWVWSRGRGLGPQIEATLSGLSIGEIAPAPIATALGVYIVKRVEVPPEAPPRVWLDRLPAPSDPDFDDVLRRVSLPALAYNLKALQQSLPTLALPDDKRKRVEVALSDTSEHLLRAQSGERVSLFARFWVAAATALSPDELQQLRTHVQTFTKYQLMSH
jgi:hypothetical protein